MRELIVVVQFPNPPKSSEHPEELGSEATVWG